MRSNSIFCYLIIILASPLAIAQDNRSQAQPKPSGTVPPSLSGATKTPPSSTFPGSSSNASKGSGFNPAASSNPQQASTGGFRPRLAHPPAGPTQNRSENSARNLLEKNNLKSDTSGTPNIPNEQLNRSSFQPNTIPQNQFQSNQSTCAANHSFNQQNSFPNHAANPPQGQFDDRNRIQHASHTESANPLTPTRQDPSDRRLNNSGFTGTQSNGMHGTQGSGMQPAISSQDFNTGTRSAAQLGNNPSAFQNPNGIAAGNSISNLKHLVNDFDVLTVDGQLPGRPKTLMQIIAASPSHLHRQTSVAYWELFQAWANWRRANDWASRLHSLNEPQIPAEKTLLGAARSASLNEVKQAENGLKRAQRNLSALVPNLSSSELILPADLPLVGSYRTRFEHFAGRRSIDQRIKQIHEQLPEMYSLMKNQADTVAKYHQAYGHVLHGYNHQQMRLSSVLETMRLAREQDRKLIGTISDYNKKIAHYAFYVAPGAQSPENIVKMLIKISPKSREMARQAGLVNSDPSVRQASLTQPVYNQNIHAGSIRPQNASSLNSSFQNRNSGFQSRNSESTQSGFSGQGPRSANNSFVPQNNAPNFR